MRTPRVSAAVTAALLLVGCSRLMPAGFWLGYQPECRVEFSSDQGPWGGTRIVRWNACGSVLFSRADVMAFAERHGWKLLDEVDVAAVARPSDGRVNPRFLDIPSVVMRFDSGWLREDPGTNEMSTAVGYVQVASDGSALCVFHSWGNG